MKNNKKNTSYLKLLPGIMIVIILFIMLVFSDTYAKNQDEIYLYIGSNYSLVNGEVRNIDDDTKVVPIALNGTTLVPIRFISEGLGYEVYWDEERYEAIISNGNQRIKLKPNDEFMNVNGENIKLMHSAEVMNNRIFVPIRAISEVFDKKVDYYKGLISISNSTQTLLNSSYNDEIIRKINILKEIETKDELIELLKENGYELKFGEIRDFEATFDIMQNFATDELTKESQVESSADSNLKLNDTINKDYSKTNVQVEGIDEGDIIKTDGDYLYQINNYSDNRVIIFDIKNPNNLNKVSELKFDDEVMPKEIYVSGDKLVIIAQGFERIKTNLSDLSTNIIEKNSNSIMDVDECIPRYTSNTFTKMYVVNIEDKKNPEIIRTSQIEGNYISSRKIGDIVYLISSKYINYLYDIMPLYYENFGTTLRIKDGQEEILEAKEIPNNKIKCILPMETKSYLNVGAVNINSEEPMKFEAYLGGGNNVYASFNNIYVTNTIYNYSNMNLEDETINAYETSIIKFSLDGTNMTYINKTKLPGKVVNKYSMDEYEDNFRIALTKLTTTKKDKGYENKKSNCVYVLNDFLNIVGLLDNIAPEEDIYSTRFIEDRLYMVTFKDVDPLFVIDLKTPEMPKILGKLKIPGYSNYIHPYDENHIIGIGKDTQDVSGITLYDGLKIALFDVTDVNNPVLEKQIFIGDRGTDSEVLNNPKALLFSKEKEIFALPIKLYETQLGFKSSYGTFKEQAMYVYKFNLEDGFKLMYKVTHMDSNKPYYDYLDVVSRGVYVDDILFTSSHGKIKSNELYTGKELDVLEIDHSEDDNKYIDYTDIRY